MTPFAWAAARASAIAMPYRIACSAPSPSEVARPKSVANTARMSMASPIIPTSLVRRKLTKRFSAVDAISKVEEWGAGAATDPAGAVNRAAIALIKKAVDPKSTAAEALAVSLHELRDRPGHEGLSQREHQVFRLLAQGQSVGQIAQALSLSSNTVSTYRARILEKTGTRNDVELALYAVRQRIVTV